MNAAAKKMTRAERLVAARHRADSISEGVWTEVRLYALELLELGQSKASVCRDLDISRPTLNKWVRDGRKSTP